MLSSLSGERYALKLGGRDDGALWPVSFLPREDRVVLPVTEEKS